jgi:hypothetical protein
MNRNKLKFIISNSAPDAQRLTVIRRDFSGGINTRQHASKIGENQVEDITNWDIIVLGETRKQKGITLIEDLDDSDAGTGAFGFQPRGGTNELLVTHGTKLEGWTGSSTFVERDTSFTTSLLTTMVKATCSGANGDVVLISNGTDNVHQMLQDHTISDLADTNTSPPKTTVMTFYRNRMWFLWQNGLYWSAALPTTYLAQCDRTTNVFGVTVGVERAVVGVRDMGLLCFGADEVYGINPSITPAATDLPEKILDIGCVAGNTVVQVADDVFFLSTDGVRGVFRSQQDKLQMGQSFPLSFPLKTQYDTISWNYISKACATYFDNKYLLALPVNSSTYNNQVWVYYPAANSWAVIDGWNVGAWAKVKFSGEERLYYIDSSDDLVYRAFYGNNNNGTAITSTLISREEDCGQPLVYKDSGVVEIEAEAAGSGNTLTVSVSIDGGDFSTLGTLDLASATAPVLPIDLPFTLSDSYIIRKKLHLDSFGRWRTLQFKFVNNDNNTDPIVLYGYNLVTFLEEYEEE